MTLVKQAICSFSFFVLKLVGLCPFISQGQAYKWGGQPNNMPYEIHHLKKFRYSVQVNKFRPLHCQLSWGPIFKMHYAVNLSPFFILYKRVMQWILEHRKILKNALVFWLKVKFKIWVTKLVTRAQKSFLFHSSLELVLFLAYRLWSLTIQIPRNSLKVLKVSISTKLAWVPKTNDKKYTWSN